MKSLEKIRAIHALAWVRQIRWGLAIAGRRIGFMVETLAVALLTLQLLVFLIVRADWYGLAAESGRFWTHYANAAAQARRPVELCFAAILLTACAVLGWIRYPAARLIWRLREEDRAW